MANGIINTPEIIRDDWTKMTWSRSLTVMDSFTTHVVMTAVEGSQNLTVALKEPSDWEIWNGVKSSPSTTPTLEEEIQCDLISKDFEIKDLKAAMIASIIENKDLQDALLASDTENHYLQKELQLVKSEYLKLSKLFDSRKRALVMSQRQRQELANSQSPTSQAHSIQSAGGEGHSSRSSGSSTNTSPMQTISRQSAGGGMYLSTSPAGVISSGNSRKTQYGNYSAQPMSRQSFSDAWVSHLDEHGNFNRSDFASFPQQYTSFNFAAQSNQSGFGEQAAGGGENSSTYPAVVQDSNFLDQELSKQSAGVRHSSQYLRSSVSSATTCGDDREFQSPEKRRIVNRSTD